MKYLIKKWSLLLIILAAVSCRKDKIEFVPDPKVVITSADVFGIVLDKSGLPIQGVRVFSDNLSTTTDKNGVFRLKDLKVKDGKMYVRAEKDGYFNGSRLHFAQKESDNYITIRLLPKKEQAVINGKTGGSVRLDGDVVMSFPQNAVVDGQGAVYEGEIHIAYQYLDPASESFFEEMPGNLIGLANDASEMALTSFGMLAVELTDAQGGNLKIAEGKHVTIDAPLPVGSGTAPMTIPMWSFDYEKGLWVEEGLASISDQRMVAEVNHFSFWNFDLKTEMIVLNGTVRYEDGSPASWIKGCLFRESGLEGLASVCGKTDLDGKFKALVGINERIELKFYDPCGIIIAQFNIGPFTQDAEIGPFEIGPSTEFDHKPRFIGNLVDCDANPVQNGYLKIEFEGTTLYQSVDQSGAFDFSQITCKATEVKLTAWDLDALKQSLTLTKDIEDEMDFGTIEICEELDEFFRWETAGELYTHIDPFYFKDDETTYLKSSRSDTVFFSLSFDGSSVGSYTENTKFIGDGIVTADCEEVSIEITSYDTFVVGSFSATECKTHNGDNQEVTGTFRVKVEN